MRVVAFLSILAGAAAIDSVTSRDAERRMSLRNSGAVSLQQQLEAGAITGHGVVTPPWVTIRLGITCDGNTMVTQQQFDAKMTQWTEQTKAHTTLAKKVTTESAALSTAIHSLEQANDANRWSLIQDVGTKYLHLAKAIMAARGDVAMWMKDFNKCLHKHAEGVLLRSEYAANDANAIPKISGWRERLNAMAGAKYYFFSDNSMHSGVQAALQNFVHSSSTDTKTLTTLPSGDGQNTAFVFYPDTLKRWVGANTKLVYYYGHAWAPNGIKFTTVIDSLTHLVGLDQLPTTAPAADAVFIINGCEMGGLTGLFSSTPNSFIQRLIDVGFTYVVAHKHVIRNHHASTFANAFFTHYDGTATSVATAFEDGVEALTGAKKASGKLDGQKVEPILFYRAGTSVLPKFGTTKSVSPSTRFAQVQTSATPAASSQSAELTESDISGLKDLFGDDWGKVLRGAAEGLDEMDPKLKAGVQTLLGDNWEARIDGWLDADANTHVGDAPDDVL